MKRKFAPVMITAAALITTVPTTQVFASEGINAETASDNITPLVINTENTQNRIVGPERAERKRLRRFWENCQFAV